MRAQAAPIPALDGVRGLAILLVLAHNLNPFSNTGRPLERWIEYDSNFGWVGVQLFFVLSGFLITGILLDTRGAPRYLRAFFARRVLRIFPLYYGVLVVGLIILPAIGLAPHRLLADPQNRVWLWIYLVNWAEPLGRGVTAFPHFWSLAVEEQFYFVWPFVVRHATPRRLLAIVGGVMVAAIAARVWVRHAGLGGEAAYMFTVCRMDALAAGAAIAALIRLPAAHAWLVARRTPLAIAAGALFVAGLVTTGGYARTGIPDQAWGYTILAVVFAVLVLLVVFDHELRHELRHERGHGWLGAIFANRVLRSFGTYSYGIYLFHQFLNQMIGVPVLDHLFPRAIGIKAGVVYMLAVTAASYAIAFVSFHAYEKHFLALKRHFVAG
ncbi:MAG TPA: acyltransferase [Kofleriaceae bacterium]|nr:acyltransferase [Kofleriaceae bacterium]